MIGKRFVYDYQGDDDCQFYNVYDTGEYVGAVLDIGIVDLMNDLVEQVGVENKKYHDLFDKYWDLMKKLNKISEVIYRYDECELEG